MWGIQLFTLPSPPTHHTYLVTPTACAQFFSAFKVTDTAARPLEEQLAIWSKEARDDHSPLATVAAHVETHAGEANSWQHKVVSSIVALLYEYRLELGAAFRVRLFWSQACGGGAFR